MIHILLADHHAPPLWALKTVLQEEPEFELVGEAVDAEGLRDLSEKYHPDLILMDRELPGEPIEDLIAALHLLDPKPVVIVMSSDSSYGRMLLKAGADAFVSKGEQVDWLLRVLQKYKKSLAQKDANNQTIGKGVILQ